MSTGFRYSAVRKIDNEPKEALMTVPDDSYWTFVREMNERANQGAYDPKKPLFELIRRARQGDRDAEAMLKTQQSRWDGKFPTYTDEELGINAHDAS